MGRVQWPHRFYIIDLGLIRLVLLQWMKLRWLESITAELRGRNVEIYESIRALRCHYLVLQVSGALCTVASERPHIHITTTTGIRWQNHSCVCQPQSKISLHCATYGHFTLYFDSKPSISTIANYNILLQWNNLSPIQLSEQQCLN